jgi:aminoglycoside phosphotransferase (APT) family kinase protein
MMDRSAVGDPSSSFGEFLVHRRADPAAAAQRLRVQVDRLVLNSRPRLAIRHQNRRLAAVIRSKIG